MTVLHVTKNDKYSIYVPLDVRFNSIRNFNIYSFMFNMQVVSKVYNPKKRNCAPYSICSIYQHLKITNILL